MNTGIHILMYIHMLMYMYICICKENIWENTPKTEVTSWKKIWREKGTFNFYFLYLCPI